MLKAGYSTLKPLSLVAPSRLARGGVPAFLVLEDTIRVGMQLPVNVQMPVDCGGLGGKGIYIDTEGSFMVESTLQTVEGRIEEISKSCNTKGDFQVCSDKWKPNNFLRIFFSRVCNYPDQVDLINNLERFISAHKDVKIVMIDSFAFHFRQEFEDLSSRTHILSGMTSNLSKLAKNSKLAVK